MAADSKFAKSLTSQFQWISAGIVLLIVILIIVPSFTSYRISDHGLRSDLQNCHAIDLMMFVYAHDHNGVYPTGKSSTEVFQQLIDGNYCTDPAIFWDGSMKIPGKIKPTSKKLKPENVCFDVTIPMDEKSSDDLPVVFMTGYRINYAPGENAVPLFKASNARDFGLAVAYHNYSAWFKKNDLHDGTITNFISTTFNPAGKKYQQLTPDGPLAP